MAQSEVLNFANLHFRNLHFRKRLLRRPRPSFYRFVARANGLPVNVTSHITNNVPNILHQEIRMKTKAQYVKPIFKIERI